MAFPWMAAAMLGSAALSRGGSTRGVKNPYYSRAFREAFKLYQETDFEAIDKAAVEEFAKGAEKRGMGLLSGYDAFAAGGGSPVSKVDTNKDLARASIAGGVAEDVSRFSSELMLSRPSRRRALLPGLERGSEAHIGLERRGSNIGDLMSLASLFPRSPRRRQMTTLIPNLREG